MNLFLEAAKNKYKFQTERGALSVEDLFDMPLVSRDGFNLDTLAVQLHNSLETKSFVQKLSSNSSVINNKFEIVKFIINHKLEEQAANEQAAVKAERKQKILAAIQNKQDSRLNDMSEEELVNELNNL